MKQKIIASMKNKEDQLYLLNNLHICSVDLTLVLRIVALYYRHLVLKVD